MTLSNFRASMAFDLVVDLLHLEDPVGPCLCRVSSMVSIYGCNPNGNQHWIFR